MSQFRGHCLSQQWPGLVVRSSCSENVNDFLFEFFFNWLIRLIRVPMTSRGILHPVVPVVVYAKISKYKLIKFLLGKLYFNNPLTWDCSENVYVDD